MTHLRRPSRTPAGHAVSAWYSEHTSQEKQFLWGALVGFVFGLILIGFFTWVRAHV